MKQPKQKEETEEELPGRELTEEEVKKLDESEKVKESWQPKTEIGKKVKDGEIKNIDELLDSGIRILEPEIVDLLLPNLETLALAVGQSKGKFGGGKKSIWKQTQKKTKEGNKPKFAILIAIGDKNGHIGIGYGKSKETVPARLKALGKAKLNLIKIRRGCGSWACSCKESHSIPFKITGKEGSSEITLIPAPKGTSIKTEEEVKKLLNLAGIKDVYSKTKGQTKTKLNLIKATINALEKLSKVKVPESNIKKLGLVEGSTCAK